jgi:hypothetical protein
LLIRLFTVHVIPDVESQPAQLPKVEPLLGVAVSVTLMPLVKGALHVAVHPSPAGTLVTVPEPTPIKSTVRVGLPKQTTFAFMVPLTRAPDEEMFPALLFVVTVAETRAFPQAIPVGVSSPAEETVTMSGRLEAQATWSVMSFVTGGWI